MFGIVYKEYIYITVAWKQDYCRHRIYFSSIIWFCHDNEHVFDRTVHGCNAVNGIYVE